MLNKILLIGNVTKDPEIKTIPSGDKVTNFSLAVNEKYKGEEKTEFFNLVAWRKTAEVIGQYVRKGSKLYVEGRITTRKWEKDGQTHTRTEVLVNQVQFLNKVERKEEAASNDLPF